MGEKAKKAVIRFGIHLHYFTPFLKKKFRFTILQSSNEA
jgi:hypothetical protein